MTTFGKTLTTQFCHQRSQHKPPGARLPYKPSNRIGRVHNIGIGQQKIFRLQFFGGINTLPKRPKFSSPPPGRSFTPDDRHFTLRDRFRRVGRRRRCLVTAVVIYYNNAKLSRILLLQEGLHAFRDIFRFIAGRDNSNHGGPSLYPGISMPVSRTRPSQKAPRPPIR